MSKVNNILRAQYVDVLSDAMKAHGEEVLIVGSNEFAMPVVDSDGNDAWVVVTVKVPIGSRDGDMYDGYSMAETYGMKCAERAEKAKLAAEKKAKKIEADERRRAEKIK